MPIGLSDHTALAAVVDERNQAAIFIRCTCEAVFVGTKEMQPVAKEFVLCHRFCQVNKDKINN